MRRLSLIYALLDCSSSIRAEHLKAAFAAWDYCEQSVRLIFGNASGYPDADRALEYIRTGGEQGRSKTDIRDLFDRNKDTEPVLLFLKEHGLANPRLEPVQGPGRPAEMWVATEYDINDRNDEKGPA